MPAPEEQAIEKRSSAHTFMTYVYYSFDFTPSRLPNGEDGVGGPFQARRGRGCARDDGHRQRPPVPAVLSRVCARSQTQGLHSPLLSNRGSAQNNYVIRAIESRDLKGHNFSLCVCCNRLDGAKAHWGLVHELWDR